MELIKNALALYRDNGPLSDNKNYAMSAREFLQYNNVK